MRTYTVSGLPRAPTYEGRPCRQGHTVRYVSGGCVACAKERSARQHELKGLAKRNPPETPDTHRARSLAYYYANRERICAKRADAGERLRQRDRHRAWRQNNKGRVAALSMQRHAAKLRRTPAWASRPRIAEVYEDAALFSKAFGVAFHVDHVCPLRGKTVSGLHVENNLQIIPATMNAAKGARWE